MAMCLTCFLKKTHQTFNGTVKDHDFFAYEQTILKTINANRHETAPEHLGCHLSTAIVYQGCQAFFSNTAAFFQKDSDIFLILGCLALFA